MANELLRLLDVGVRRRKRRLKYAQRLASTLESSMQIADLDKAIARFKHAIPMSGWFSGSTRR